MTPKEEEEKLIRDWIRLKGNLIRAAAWRRVRRERGLRGTGSTAMENDEEGDSMRGATIMEASGADRACQLPARGPGQKFSCPLTDRKGRCRRIRLPNSGFNHRPAAERCLGAGWAKSAPAKGAACSCQSSLLSRNQRQEAAKPASRVAAGSQRSLSPFSAKYFRGAKPFLQNTAQGWRLPSSGELAEARCASQRATNKPASYGSVHSEVLHSPDAHQRQTNAMEKSNMIHLGARRTAAP